MNCPDYDTTHPTYKEYVANYISKEEIYYPGEFIVMTKASWNDSVAGEMFLGKDYRTFYQGNKLKIVKCLGKPPGPYTAGHHLTYLVEDYLGKYGCVRSNGTKLISVNELLRIQEQLKIEINGN